MNDSNLPQTQEKAEHERHLKNRPTYDAVAGVRLPHVVLFGGQNHPPLTRLVGCWRSRCAALLPPHRLSVVAWPTLDGQRAGEHTEVLMLDTEARRRTRAPIRRMPRWLGRKLGRIVTAFVAWLDARMRVSADGTPENWPSRFTCQFIRYTVAVLYGNSALNGELIELAIQTLGERPVDVVIGHSLGGTIALLAAHEMHQRDERFPPFDLITLGTSSGPAITRSPWLQRLPRTPDGRIALPAGIRSWTHVWSASDALVAAPSLPVEFAGVDLAEVDTGVFSFENHAHALGAYLAVPEVLAMIRSRITP